MDKSKLIAAMVAELGKQLATLERSAASAREGATHEEARPENEYDTRGLEASYLAGAQLARADQLRVELAQLRQMKLRDFKSTDAIQVGALVELEDDDGKRGLYFLAPSRGLTVKVGAKSVTALALTSPLGRELLGKRADDSVEISVRGETRGYSVLGIR